MLRVVVADSSFGPASLPIMLEQRNEAVSAAAQ